MADGMYVWPPSLSRGRKAHRKEAHICLDWPEKIATALVFGLSASQAPQSRLMHHDFGTIILLLFSPNMINGWSFDFCVASRSDYFIVGLTTVSPEVTAPTLRSNYAVCGEYPGAVGAGATVYQRCDSCLPAYRYVIVQFPSDWTPHGLCKFLRSGGLCSP